MKVHGLMGSSRRDENINHSLDAALRGAAKGKAEVEQHELIDDRAHRIYNCQACKQRGQCPEDDWPLIQEKIFAANGLIWATLLYRYAISGLTKVVLDRLCCTMVRFTIFRL